jgi:hypothetical protein
LKRRPTPPPALERSLVVVASLGEAGMVYVVDVPYATLGFRT